MAKKIYCLAFLLAAVFVLSTRPAVAGAQPVFGPERYERQHGAPLVVRKHFTSATTGQGFVLQVRNGNRDGTHRVVTGSVRINGRVVVRPLDFGRHVEEFERTVTLYHSNVIETTVMGPPGSFLILTIASRGVLPVVSLSASPNVIHAGGSTTLVWSSSGADHCTLDQGIGDLPVEGSLTVAPRQTTTYSIVAGGPGGTATATVQVRVENRSPEATHDEATTDEGKAVTINVLDNDFDPDGDPISIVSTTQGAHGTVTVNPEATITYTPTAGFVGTDQFIYEVSDGWGGTASASVLVTIKAPPELSLEILSPATGQLLPYPWVEVTGSMHNPWGKETGVVVNGVAAAVSEGMFLAHRVPLLEGENALTAKATDVDGHTRSASVTVQLSPSLGPLRLTTMQFTGVAPLETLLLIDASAYYSPPSLSWTGPGEVELLPGTDPKEQRIRINSEGFYQVTLQASSRDGEVHEDTVSIIVLSREALDGLLRAKWTGMKEQLQRGAVEEALGFFLESSRDRYRRIFNDLGGAVPGIVAGMQDIEMIKCRNHSAEYRINREHWVNGRPVTITYSIYFEVDENGFWKIDRF